MNTKTKRTETNTPDRRARWRRHVSKRLAEIRDVESTIPQEWIETAEGRPLVDLITDHICNEHGYGVKDPDWIQKYRRDIDDKLERGNVLARNNEERSTARMSTEMVLMGTGHVPARSEAMHRLILRFYRPGDCGISNSITRAIEAATK